MGAESSLCELLAHLDGRIEYELVDILVGC